MEGRNKCPPYHLTTNATLMMNLTVPLRVYILNYLGETQEELMTLTLVSEQMHEDCTRLGVE
jgi:hypothetical protein